MAFTAEFLLFYFHSTNHQGLEGRYHMILVLLIGLCILCALLATAYPESFAVDILSGMAITLQGAWFYMIAFTLYGPLMPFRCTDDHDEIVCDAEPYEARGQALAHIQLSILIPCLWVFVLVVYGVAAALWGHSDLYHPPGSELNDFKSDTVDSPMSWLGKSSLRGTLIWVLWIHCLWRWGCSLLDIWRQPYAVLNFGREALYKVVLVCAKYILKSPFLVLVAHENAAPVRKMSFITCS